MVKKVMETGKQSSASHAGFGQNQLGRLFIRTTKPQCRPTKFKSPRLRLSTYKYFLIPKVFLVKLRMTDLGGIWRKANSPAETQGP